MTDEPSVPLLYHLEALLERDRQHHAELRAADQLAVAVAVQTVKEQREEDKRANDHRFETGNNQRGQAEDERHGYMTIAAFDQFKASQVEASRAGGTGVRQYAALAISLIVAVVVVIQLFLP